MAVITLGLFSNTLLGLEGSILLALAHGFVSPALFIICGGIIYSRTHSRVIAYHRGMAYYMPLFSIFFLLFTLSNSGIPLSLNFVGEITSLMGIWSQSPIVSALGATGIVLSACYSLFLYNRISYGSYSPFLLPLKDIDRREFMLLFTLLIPTLILGIFPNIILNALHPSISLILYS
jgi:NADH-ubiquinone oxidoreductase chain 4